MLVPIQNLFEAHLHVSNLPRSVAFYGNLLGLPMAANFPDRRVAFFWVGAPGKAMLGLWDIGTSPQRQELHVAFSVALVDLMNCVETLHNSGIRPLDFYGDPTDGPVVLAWMPAASVYFRDPDNNLLEFITMLPDLPRPDIGIVTWKEWLQSAPSDVITRNRAGGSEEGHEAYGHPHHHRLRSGCRRQAE